MTTDCIYHILVELVPIHLALLPLTVNIYTVGFFTELERRSEPFANSTYTSRYQRIARDVCLCIRKDLVVILVVELKR